MGEKIKVHFSNRKTVIIKKNSSIPKININAVLLPSSGLDFWRSVLSISAFSLLKSRTSLPERELLNQNRYTRKRRDRVVWCVERMRALT